MFEKLRLRLALRQNFDGEWAGEIGTLVWSRLASEKTKPAVEALYECERANRIALGQALKESGSLVPYRNPLVMLPAAMAGVYSAMLPASVFRKILGSNYAQKGVIKNFEKLANEHGADTADLFRQVGERHRSAFMTFSS